MRHRGRRRQLHPVPLDDDDDTLRALVVPAATAVLAGVVAGADGVESATAYGDHCLLRLAENSMVATPGVASKSKAATREYCLPAPWHLDDTATDGCFGNSATWVVGRAGEVAQESSRF